MATEINGQWVRDPRGAKGFLNQEVIEQAINELVAIGKTPTNANIHFLTGGSIRLITHYKGIVMSKKLRELAELKQRVYNLELNAAGMK